MVNRLPGFSEIVDVVTQGRFEKLYRRLYNAFFIDDFVHKKDYEEVVKLLNQRITQLEAQHNTAIAANAAATLALSQSVATNNQAVNVALKTHVHPVSTIVTTTGGPGTGAGTAAAASPAPPDLPPPPVPKAPTPAQTASTGSQALNISKTHPKHKKRDGDLRRKFAELSPLTNLPPVDPETLADATILSVDREGSI